MTGCVDYLADEARPSRVIAFANLDDTQEVAVFHREDVPDSIRSRVADEVADVEHRGRNQLEVVVDGFRSERTRESEMNLSEVLSDPLLPSKVLEGSKERDVFARSWLDASTNAALGGIARIRLAICS